MGRPDPVGPFPAGVSPRGDGAGEERPALPSEVPDTAAADLASRTETRLPEVRYHPLGTITVHKQVTDPMGETRVSVGVVMCLRCGCPVVAMETARHDADHIIAAGGYIAPGAWALIERPLGF